MEKEEIRSSDSAEKKQENKSKNIQWHPAFCSAVVLEFLANRNDLTYENEYNLSRKPLQIDLLVIKKSGNAVIENEIGRIFRRDNIMEFKSPHDRLNINDYFKVLAYACLYKAQGEVLNDLNSKDVTVTLVQYSRPKKLFQALREQGLRVDEYVSGIYYIENQWFPMQVVVISELDHREHQWIRALTEKLSEDEAAALLNKASEVSGTGIEDLVDSVMTVSMAANKGSFKPLISYEKGDLGMYQFAKILFEDEIKEEKMKTAKRMLTKRKLTHEEIAEYTDLSLEEVESLAKEAVSKLQTV